MATKKGSGRVVTEAEERPELLVNWSKERKNIIKTDKGENRIKIFKESYRGMPYEIHVIYDKNLEEFRDYDKGMWATLEHPEGMEHLYEAISDFLKSSGAYIEDDNFCYHDTAHFYNEGQDINARIMEMREEAHHDIDTFYEYLARAGPIIHSINRIKMLLTKGEKNENKRRD